MDLNEEGRRKGGSCPGFFSGFEVDVVYRDEDQDRVKIRNTKIPWDPLSQSTNRIQGKKWKEKNIEMWTEFELEFEFQYLSVNTSSSDFTNFFRGDAGLWSLRAPEKRG